MLLNVYNEYIQSKSLLPTNTYTLTRNYLRPIRQNWTWIRYLSALALLQVADVHEQLVTHHHSPDAWLNPTAETTATPKRLLFSVTHYSWIRSSVCSKIQMS